MTRQSRREALTSLGAGLGGLTLATGAVRAGSPQRADTPEGKDMKNRPAAASFHLERLLEQQRAAGRPWHGFLRVPSMSMGLYCLAAGSEDGQKPHDEDEVYYVVAGAGKFRVEDSVETVQPGAILFVPAHAEHRFEDITEDLTLLVFFSSGPTE